MTFAVHFVPYACRGVRSCRADYPRPQGSNRRQVTRVLCQGNFVLSGPLRFTRILVEEQFVQQSTSYGRVFESTSADSFRSLCHSSRRNLPETKIDVDDTAVHYNCRVLPLALRRSFMLSWFIHCASSMMSSSRFPSLSMTVRTTSTTSRSRLR